MSPSSPQPALPPSIDQELIHRVLPSAGALLVCLLVWQIFAIDASIMPQGNPMAVIMTVMVLGVIVIVAPTIYEPWMDHWTTLMDYLHGEFVERTMRRIVEFTGVAMFMAYLAGVAYALLWGLVGLAITVGYWRFVTRQELVSSVGRSAMSTAVILFVVGCLGRHYGWHGVGMWSRIIVIALLGALVAMFVWMSEPRRLNT
jgi:hypothetical protein